MSKHIKRIVFAFGVLFGAALMMQGGYMQAKAWLAQYLIADAWQATLSGQHKVKPWFYADTYPVAKLRVPALDVERYVLAEANLRTLAFGPAFLAPDLQLSSLQSPLIAGHNDSHFAFLAAVQRGQILQVQQPSGQWWQYKVTDLSVILATDTAFLAQVQPSSTLYLATCYPFNSPVAGTTQRYLVTAQRMSDA
ncbi:class GN sortase [Pseudoalteromonas tunicata]|uniref:class GN sortase n=1 Tax=Pseudoalteromonas tunicata TaxID=314281 RepID=UPI00273F0ABD|nr:class GN sortase [Pseudoalteromonas tunicata]MDP4983818.1 class GN sortase [Pseudoalteromonas tunicata]MDP5214020.1 class GN sortase [Pseudoalteromonas tunicata]